MAETAVNVVAERIALLTKDGKVILPGYLLPWPLQ
jgi:hypothetical protein